MLKQGLIAFLVLSASPVDARDWPDAGGWTILDLSSGCGVHQEFEGKGSTELMLSMQLDGGTILIVENDDWSYTEDAKYDLVYLLNNTGYEGKAFSSKGKDGKNGFAAFFARNFVDDFAAAKSLTIMRGKTIVDDLSLTGTAAAVRSMRQCFALKQRKLAAEDAEKRRLDHITDDPFAAPKP